MYPTREMTTPTTEKMRIERAFPRLFSLPPAIMKVRPENKNPKREKIKIIAKTKEKIEAILLK